MRKISFGKAINLLKVNYGNLGFLNHLLLRCCSSILSFEILGIALKFSSQTKSESNNRTLYRQSFVDVFEYI